ncbi:MAG TPA: molecular chaperone TorD family protein [Solirubrobacteraceae bacterium]|nr:molecular chaperone TorD family protein [Solirubrobacteraceae bacterium]
MSGRTRARALALLADLLDYPRPGLAAAARACRDLVARESPDAAASLASFADVVAATPPGRLEELYSGVFDLDASCYPYVGHHLLGESYRRSRFMVGLAERYRAHGFEAAGELPDHLVVVLRFLAAHPGSELAEELVAEALLPALAKMTREGGAHGHPYARVLEAVRAVLSAFWPDAAVRTELAAVGG